MKQKICIPFYENCMKKKGAVKFGTVEFYVEQKCRKVKK